MAVVVPAGFQVTSQDPIDSRITVVDQTARLALNEFNVYPGLIVYQQSTQEVYVLNNTGSVNSNSGWSILSGSAGGSSYAAEWSLGASGNNDYVFSGDGFPNPASDPTLILVRGQDYKFSNDNGAGLHPFQIQTDAPIGGGGTPYNAGVTNNGGAGGTVITWNVPFSAPDQLYYQCTSHSNMSGSIRLLNTGSAGSTVNTGSLLTTGSVSLNTLTFTKGDGTTFALTVDTGSAGSTVNTGSLLTTGSVSLNTLTFTKGDGTTFALTVDTGSGGGSGVGFPFTGSALITGSLGITGSLSVSGSIINELTSSYAMTASFADTAITATTASNIVFDGNRKISNVSMPSGVFDVNYGGTDLKQFVENVFFVNSAPVLQDTASISIGEYEAIGTNVFVATAVDAEAQVLTFITQSSYTDNYFGINSSTGQVTVNTKTIASMNTVNTGSVDKAPFPVRVTDTGGLFGERTYYIRVIPNTAPIWSLTNSGTALNPNYTGSLTEASAIGANKYQFWFRDTEGDTITIGTGSLNTDFTNYFSLNIQSNYIGLDQNNPLDFDTVPSMSFVLTASDQHYQSGDDLNAIKYLPVKIEVQDNAHPTIGIQSFSINEKSSDGATVGTVTNVSDGEGNNVQIPTFNLVSAHLASSPGTNLTQSLVAGGQNSLQNPTADPFEISNQNTRVITRKNGIFLNSDVADTYTYRAFATDQYQPAPSASAIMTITVNDHAAATVTDNTPWYIIESARTGEYATTDTDGIPENSGEYSELQSSQSQRYSISSSNNFMEGTVATGSATFLRLASNLSSSGVVGGQQISVQVTASQNDFDTTIQELDYNISVVSMVAPSISNADISNNLNTNGARPSNNLSTLSITDPQGYSIDHTTWTFTPNSGDSINAVRNGGTNQYYIQPTANLIAATYGYTASVYNDRGFVAGELKSTLVVTQAPVGTLGGNTTSYIIESAVSGDQIKVDSNGYTGTQADLDVTYSPIYNSAAVAAFTSSNSVIAINSVGELTAGSNISGSFTSGNIINSNINWQDQYGNIGGPTQITINVTDNLAPTVSYSLNNSNLTASIANTGVTVATVTANDSQGFNVIDVTLGGANASDFNLVETTTPPNSNRVFNIQPTSNLSAATYNIAVTAKDAYGQETTEAQALVVAAFPNIPEIFAYISSRGASTALTTPSQYQSALGTGGQADRPIGLWQSGLLGRPNENITTTGTNNMRLIRSASVGIGGSTVGTMLSTDSKIGTFNAVANGKSSNVVFFLMPSGSDPRLGGVPQAMVNGFGSPVAGQFVMSYFGDNVDKGEVNSNIDYAFNLGGAGFTGSDGTIINSGDAGYYSDWVVLGTEFGAVQSSIKFYVTSQSGSSPV